MDDVNDKIKTMLDHNEFYKKEQGAAFKAICNRKQFQKIKTEFIIGSGKLETNKDASFEVLLKYEHAKNGMNIMEGEMKIIEGNSEEENIDIVLKNLSISANMHYIMSILTKKEIVYFVNNKLGLGDIFLLDTKDLLDIYEAAHEFSSKFNKDKVDAVVEKICDDAEENMIYQDDAIKYNAYKRKYINNRPYLPDEVKHAICEKLEALEVLYSLKQSS